MYSVVEIENCHLEQFVCVCVFFFFFFFLFLFLFCFVLFWFFFLYVDKMVQRVWLNRLMPLQYKMN